MFEKECDVIAIFSLATDLFPFRNPSSRSLKKGTTLFFSFSKQTALVCGSSLHCNLPRKKGLRGPDMEASYFNLGTGKR